MIMSPSGNLEMSPLVINFGSLKGLLKIEVNNNDKGADNDEWQRSKKIFRNRASAK